MLGVLSSEILPAGARPPPWLNVPEHEELRETLNATNCFASSDNGTGLTAEFPFGADTSMLMIKADERHPSPGSGIGMFLHLPIRTTRDDAADWARALNQMEVHETSGWLGHQLGAWTNKSFSGSGLWFPAFASFLPAFVYRPLLLTNLAHALASKAHELGRRIKGTEEPCRVVDVIEARLKGRPT